MAIFERLLKENTEMRISVDEANSIVQHFVQSPTVIPVIDHQPSKVSLAPVHTYVHQISKSPILGSQSGIVVPAFASHWGVIVDHPNGQMLYHLVFAPVEDREVDSSKIDNGDIKFHVTKILKPLPNTKYVGTTRFSVEELDKLGTEMIAHFGNYHRVFWNCQTFAKCFLRVITGNIGADFDDWTVGDTSRLFLNAFLIGAPFATTSKIREQVQTQKMVQKFMEISSDADITEQSSQAIMALYHGLQEDPSLGSEVGAVEDVVGRLGFIQRLLRMLFKKSAGQGGRINQS